MKKGFTLIEVMVCVVIVVIVSFSLLSLSSNSKYLFNLISNQNDFSLKTSIIAIEQKSGNLYENLIEFNITNDEVIKSLKKYKYQFKKTKDIKVYKNMKFTQEIDRLEIYNKENQIKFYEVKIK